MPYAIANIKGNYLAPHLQGTVEFFPWQNGTIVKVEVMNLPAQQTTLGHISSGMFAFHIHEGASCGIDNVNNNFHTTGGHFNPTNNVHPFHAGDLPSLLANNGYAYMIVYTDRFKPLEVINRAVIIHQNPDDYRTQPSGNSGNMIACGSIKQVS